jgi:hypothetical protein
LSLLTSIYYFNALNAFAYFWLDHQKMQLHKAASGTQTLMHMSMLQQVNVICILFLIDI